MVSQLEWIRIPPVRSSRILCFLKGEELLDRDRRRRILLLALPIIGGMVSQNVLNLVDTAMVGTLGAAALAAVGMGSFANFMAMAFVMGLSAGV
jgi:MATE family multidrug resistance protein